MIGGCETAASMLNELFRHRVSTITVISPQVTLFTRGEGFFENTLYSDPTDWSSLTLSDRILGADFGPTTKSPIRRSDEHQPIR